jgi:hypothetical protein
MTPNRKPGGALALILACAAVFSAAQRPVAAQAIGGGQAFELERAGRHADAASIYFSTLRADPANLPALLGLERVLPPLSRLPELLPFVRRARALAPQNSGFRGLEVRVYAELHEDDSLEAVARRWAVAAPRSESPYREWAIALADRRDFDASRRVLLLGRRTLGGEATMSVELAELEERLGNWEASAREWARAVGRAAEIIPNAASHLSDAPINGGHRDRVIRALSAPDGPVQARRLGAELLLMWGQPAEGWTLFATTLNDPPNVETAAALRRYADLAGALTTPAGHRVRGLALTRWADLAPAPLAGRARAEAVRELLDGGDREAARQVLERLAGDSQALPDAQGLAEAALVEVLIADSQLDAAEKRLADSRRPLTGEDRGRLRLALAEARIAKGELDRAADALGDDSSVAALAQRGWIALYQGDLEAARTSFRAAGPYAGDRAAATQRTAMLALLARVPAERSAELGAALLTLARGDSGGAIAALRRAAGQFDVAGGRLDVLLVAGQVAARLGGAHEPIATSLFEEITRAAGGEGAAAPAAELEWARLLIRQGRATQAVERLEHLILTYPGSAVVPEARRELERARGAIPRS